MIALTKRSQASGNEAVPPFNPLPPFRGSGTAHAASPGRFPAARVPIHVAAVPRESTPYTHPHQYPIPIYSPKIACVSSASVQSHNSRHSVLSRRFLSRARESSAEKCIYSAQARISKRVFFESRGLLPRGSAPRFR